VVITEIATNIPPVILALGNRADCVPGARPDSQRSAPDSGQMTDDRGRSFFIRNLLAGEPLERFLVSAVAAVLGSASFWGSPGFLSWAAAACTSRTCYGVEGSLPRTPDPADRRYRGRPWIRIVHRRVREIHH
jgi:hypothetical protein